MKDAQIGRVYDLAACEKMRDPRKVTLKKKRQRLHCAGFATASRMRTGISALRLGTHRSGCLRRVRETCSIVQCLLLRGRSQVLRTLCVQKLLETTVMIWHNDSPLGGWSGLIGGDAGRSRVTTLGDELESSDNC